MTGVQVDLPGRRVGHPARVGDALGPFSLHGLRAGDVPVSVHVDGVGAVTVDLPAGTGLEVWPGGWQRG